MNIVSTSAFPTTISNSAKLGAGLRKRLGNMTAAYKKRGPLGAAYQVAKDSVSIKDKAQGRKPATAYEKGKRFKEVVVRTLGIVTDSSGQTAVKVAKEATLGQAEISEKRRKEEKEKYGGSPTVIERLPEFMDEVEKSPLTRRMLLFSGPKHLATEAAAGIATVTLPWPLNKIAQLINYIKDEKAV